VPRATPRSQAKNEARRSRGQLEGSVRAQFSYWAERLDDEQLRYAADHLGELLTAAGNLLGWPGGGPPPARPGPYGEAEDGG
jgi:hypothetical protein